MGSILVIYRTGRRLGRPLATVEDVAPGSALSIEVTCVAESQPPRTEQINCVAGERIGQPVALPKSWCRARLSPAEQRVVELVAAGLSTKEAADRLGKAPHTARNQLDNAMRKLNVNGRYQLMVALRSAANEEAESHVGDATAFAYAI